MESFTGIDLTALQNANKGVLHGILHNEELLMINYLKIEFSTGLPI